MKRKIGNYISLKEASKISGLTSDHLGLLIRKGKLGGKKIGRDYFTTKNSLSAYKKTGYFLAVDSSFFQKQICFLKIFLKRNSFVKILAIIAVVLFLFFSGYSFFFKTSFKLPVKNNVYKIYNPIKNAVTDAIGKKTNGNESAVINEKEIVIYEIKETAKDNKENANEAIGE